MASKWNLPVTDRRRVLQWGTFARTWWIYDANHQCPFKTAPKLCLYLRGMHKPIYHPIGDLGDHVVVVNTKHISMPDRFWRGWRHFSHKGYAGSFKSERAWQVHRQDPTEVLRKQIYATLPGVISRKTWMCRLHLFPELEIPEDIMNNISGQIRQVMPVPKSHSEYSKEDHEDFPRLFEWPDDYRIREGKSFEKLHEYITEDHQAKNKQ